MKKKCLSQKCKESSTLEKIYIDFINILEREELSDPDIVKDLDSWKDE